MEDFSSDIRRFPGSFQESPGGDTPAASVNCNQFGAWLESAIWADLQLLGVGWSNIHPIALIKITCSRGQIINLDLKILCHMDRSMSGYFLMMDYMPPDGLWDCDELSMEDGHCGGQ
jgi:hypothetical protein